MNRIHQLRKENKYTMQQLADKCGVGRSSISQYESGQRLPSNATQEALADIFNVDIDYLMGRTEIRRKIDLEGFINNNINSGEVDLIKAYRSASPQIQKAVRLMLGIDHD